MSWSEKMKIKENLRENIARWMMEHGRVISDRCRSNAYVGVRTVKVEWRGFTWEISWVDGMVCRIEKC